MMEDNMSTDPVEPAPEAFASTEAVESDPAGEWVAPPTPEAEDAVDPTVGAVGPNAVDEETVTPQEVEDLPPGPLYSCNNCGALLLQREDGSFVNSVAPFDTTCSGNDGGAHEVD